jgi:hypothetical protein
VTTTESRLGRSAPRSGVVFEVLYEPRIDGTGDHWTSESIWVEFGRNNV